MMNVTEKLWRNFDHVKDNRHNSLYFDNVTLILQLIKLLIIMIIICILIELIVYENLKCHLYIFAFY